MTNEKAAKDRRQASRRGITRRCRRGASCVAVLLGLAAASALGALEAGEVSYEVLHHFVPYPEGRGP